MQQRRKTKKGLAGAVAGMLGAGALCLAAPAAAADDKQLEALQKQLAQLQKEIEQIKQQQAKAPAPLQAAAAPAAASVGVGLGQYVTMYGILDGGIERITNVTDGANHGNVTRMPSITGTIASRLGFNASKEIRPGLKAIATLEAGFNFDDGTLGQGGRIFGRQLFAGVQTDYGSFTFGRQYSMLLYGMGGADLLGPNIYALGSLDAYLPNARYDNSIAWRGQFGKFGLGATYSTGRDTKGGAPASGTCAGEIAGSSQCRGWSAMVKYDDDAFGLAAAIDQQHGGTGATAYFFNGAAPIALTRSQDSDRRITASGYVKLGDGHKIGLGWLGREVDAASGTVKSNAYFLEGAYKVSDKITLDGGAHRITNKKQDRNATLLVLRGYYWFDKDFGTYLQVGHIDNSAKARYAVSVGAGVSPAAGDSQVGTMVGLRYKF